jgi:hypothetical protein
MDRSNNVLEAVVELMREIQLTLRDVRAELVKWKDKPGGATAQWQTGTDKPPTEKQLQYLKGLGIEEIPTSKIEARQMLAEIIEKRETGEYSIPPTEKQFKYLKSLGYEGPVPETKEEAWELIQELKGI